MAGFVDDGRRVTVRFTTKLPPHLRVPPKVIAVPSNLTRMGLSEIVNSLLKTVADEHETQPFDFLIDDELVRMPLEEFLLAKGISVEKTLEIEYTIAVFPRKQQEPLLHDDWVSAVDGSNSSFVLTGCYDGFARLWKHGAECTHILSGHSGAITSAKFINGKESENKNNLHIVTGSKDRSLRLWKFDNLESSEHQATVRAYKILQGHSSSVQSICSNPTGQMVCSGSWDSTIKLWEVSDSKAEDDSVSIKKRKLVSDSTKDEEQLEGVAASTFVGHTQCVSSVVWPEDEVIYSASWDHFVRQWDVQKGIETWNTVCGKVLNCLDVGSESSSLIAAGGSDPILRVWDPRKPGTLAPSFQFLSHSSWITACKWHNKSWFHLLSASYDGKVMLWDLRTAWPLAIIDSHKDKVLCADWWKDNSVISGGADSKLDICSGITIY